MPDGTAWIAGEAPLAVPTVTGWDAPVLVGMPQLSRGGLSETWLLKECGHRHWMRLAASLGMPVPDFRDAEGRRVYAAFNAAALEDADLAGIPEHSVLHLEGTMARATRTQFVSRHTLRVGSRTCGTVRLASVFVRRREEGVNRSIERTLLRAAPAFETGRQGAPSDPLVAAAHAVRSGAWESHAGFRRAERACLATFEVDPCPHADFNGADFLYFASLQAFVDRAEWAWFRRTAPLPTTRRRTIVFAGNIELGDTVTVRLCGLRQEAGSLAHWCEVLCRGDGRRIAEVMTLRSA